MSQLHASMYEAVMSKSGFAFFFSSCFPEETSAVAATKHATANRLKILRIRPPFEYFYLGPAGGVTADSMPAKRPIQAPACASAATIRFRVSSFQLLNIKLFRGRQIRGIFSMRRAKVTFIRRVAAPLAQLHPESSRHARQFSPSASHQSPSAPATHCVATYGVSCNTASLRFVKIAVHRKSASATRTRIIAASRSE